jgi:hypothetical protein
MILYILLEQHSCYASFEKMRISGYTKKEEHNVCKSVVEGISTGWKMSFQNSGKLIQYECNNIQFTTV